MKIEIEITEAQLAQIMWSLGQAVALLRDKNADSDHYVPIDTLQCLAGIFLQKSEGYGGRCSEVVLLRKLISPGGTAL
jgi:hypothetical protein